MLWSHHVKIWSVGLAVEMLDGTEAIKRADQVTLPRSPPRERVGHHWIDLSRGYSYTAIINVPSRPSIKPGELHHSRPVTTPKSMKPCVL